ncbi:MAG: hypothetical protein Q9227_004384 [Pyrenula ochraceoflavens]
MNDSGAHSSPVPSPRGLKKVLSKAKQSANTRKSESGTDLALRSSVSSTADKDSSQHSEESSLVESNKSDGSGIRKFIRGHSKKSKRFRRESELQRRAEEDEAQRGRKALGPNGQNTLGVASNSHLNQSSSSLNNDAASSLLTDDSEPDLARPQLSTRDSHAGYLTTSSPLITTTAVDHNNSVGQVDGSQANVTVDSGEKPGEPTQFELERPSTAPLPAFSSDPNLSQPKRADTLAIPDYQKPRRGSINSIRGISPGRKLKEAFTPKSTKDSDISPDRASSGSDGQTRLLANGAKKNSLSARRQAKAAEDPPPVPPVPAAIKTNLSETQRAASASLPALDTSGAPRTPPETSVKAPLITATPPTPTESTHTTPKSSPKKKSGTDSVENDSGIVVSPSGNMISHRRARSSSAVGQPSKLSNSVLAPLTPTVEEARSPGSGSKSGSKESTPQSTGFFSSWGLQNAASFFTNPLNTQSLRNRSGTGGSEPEKSNETEISEQEPPETETKERKELAVDTLGKGSLNFGHLGLDMNGPEEKGEDSSTPENGPQRSSAMLRDEASAREEDARAARAVSMAYEKPAINNVVDDTAINTTPRHSQTFSGGNLNLNGDHTTPNGSVFEEDTGSVKRSNSIRSKMTSKRNRGSSGATGNSAIAAMIGASTATLAHPATGPRLPGFTTAPRQRNRTFHQLFRSVPEDDLLIEDYSCALQRDILLAGRIYISEGHICFSSNILGWVTTLVISFDEIVSIEKETTAMVFPNAIAIQTLHARHTFRSLLSREATYDLMIGIWKANHPGTFKSSVNGVQLERGTGDKTEKTTESEGDSDAASEEEEEIYDEDAEEDGAESFVDSGSVAGSDTSNLKSVSRKTSAINAQDPGTPYPSMAGDVVQGEKVAAVMAEATVDYPGPTTHAPTECSDGAAHYTKPLKDEVLPAPLGKIYSMVFGPTSGAFLTRYLLDEQKVFDLNLDDDKKGISNESKTRSFNYIRPLSGSIGPKQTKCITTEQIDFLDLEKSVSVTCTTQTPDVPSGSVFSVKTRYCLTWAPGNATRVVMNCAVEWTGPIEKGALEGQQDYANDLLKALKVGVSSRQRAHTGASRSVGKGKKKKKPGSLATSPTSAETKAVKAENWGLFEPLRGLMGPILDILKPLISTNLIIGILLVLLIIMWIRTPSRTGAPSLGHPALSNSQRQMAYEEMWRHEEGELWEWLENRIGFNSLTLETSKPTGKGGGAQKKSAKDVLKDRKKILRGKDSAARLEEEKMSQREMQDMIKVAQERLDVLKGVLEAQTKDQTTGEKHEAREGL